MKKALFKTLMTAAFSILLSFTVMGQSDDDKQKQPPKKKDPPKIELPKKNDRPKDDKKDKPKKPPGEFAFMMFAAKQD